jgi:hypothetical protein
MIEPIKILNETIAGLPGSNADLSAARHRFESVGNQVKELRTTDYTSITAVASK